MHYFVPGDPKFSDRMSHSLRRGANETSMQVLKWAGGPRTTINIDVKKGCGGRYQDQTAHDLVMDGVLIPYV